MLGAVLLAAGVSFLATPLVKLLAYKVGAVDVPKDNRRMHKVPIPRLGGLAIFIAFMFSVLIFAQIDTQTKGILLGATIIVVLGVLDDIMALPALPKFVVQIFAAVVVVLHGCRIEFLSNPVPSSAATYMALPEWLSVTITIIWIVAITNAVNFIDGLDGLAVGVSGISAATMLVVALMVAENNIAVIMAALLGAFAAQMALGFGLGHHGRHLFVQRRRQRGQSRFHVLMYGRFGYAQHAGRLSHRSARRGDIFRLAQHPALHRLIHAHPPRQSRYSELSYAGMLFFSLATVRVSSRQQSS